MNREELLSRMERIRRILNREIEANPARGDFIHAYDDITSIQMQIVANPPGQRCPCCNGRGTSMPYIAIPDDL